MRLKAGTLRKLVCLSFGLFVLGTSWASTSEKLPTGRLPFYFIENQGQIDNQIKYYSPEGQFYFTPEGMFTHLIERESLETSGQDSTLIHEKHVVLKKRFLNSNTSCEIVGEDELPGKVNFFVGKDSTQWKTHLRIYKQLRYKNIYPGIDLVYHGKNGPTEYDLVVNPGASVSQIQSVIEGADKLELSSDGDLLVHTRLGILKEKSPVSYQDISGTKHSVPSQFTLLSDNTLTFSVPQYLKSKTLTIDPLIYSSFLGSNDVLSLNNDVKIAVDPEGNYYIAGVTKSNSFPTTPGSYDRTYSGEEDGFITKINAAGTEIIFSTYLGGSLKDLISGMCIDTAGNVYVTGMTKSTNFPITSGAYDSTLNLYDYTDVFVSKLSASGASLEYSTLLGGDKTESSLDIAVDLDGCAYVVGFTSSPVFFPLVSAFDTTGNSNGNGYITKLNSTGTALEYSSFISGSAWTQALGVAVDSSKKAYIVGATYSSDFPVTSDAIDSTYNAGGDGFLTVLEPSGALSYATYLGGSGTEYVYSVALDSVGDIYVAGLTSSIDYPTTPGVVRRYFVGQEDAFVTKLNPAGTQMLYSTYLAGSGEDYVNAIKISSRGTAVVTGYTSSTNFPVSSYPIDNTANGNGDVFVSELNSTGTELLYSTYLGGSGKDHGSSLAFDSAGNVCIAGYTESASFPITKTALVKNYNNNFFAKLSLINASPSYYPNISNLPDLKLFTYESVSNIFSLEDYNNGPAGENYSFATNFLSLGSLSGSYVSQGAYSSGTCGTNTYVVSNLYGSCTVSNKVKYSTYKMRKLPDVALKPGQSEHFDITAYCYDTAGATVAPSFGYPDSILEGNPSWVTGNWDGTTQVIISSQSGFTTGQSHLDLIASTITTEPFTTDYDVERINVYPDLLSGGAFSSDTDLNAQFGVEGISGLSLPTLGYQSTVTDNGGRELSGVVSFGFTGNTEGVKLTPNIDTMVSCDSGAWYTARIRVFSPNAGNTMEAQVYNFRGIIPSDSVVDLGANILFGVPTTWSWVDIPVYTTATGKGYPQIILKGGSTSGTVYLQSVQYFKGTPSLMDTNRGNHDLNYAYAKPTTMDQLTTGWANGELYGAETPTGVGFSFESSVLVLDYSGASAGNQKGSKVTAKKPAGGVYTGATLPGYQAGMKIQVTKASGSFNTYNAILLLACYGVQNEGGYDFWSTGGQLIASAQFGDISNGWHYLAAPVRNPWQQFQFVTKNDQAGKIQVQEVDFLRDRDDPNLGDGTLF